MERTIPAWLAVAATLVLVPAPGQAQEAPQARGPAQMMFVSPAEAVLELRRELSLTDAQIARLETLTATWSEAHAAKVELLRERALVMQGAREGTRADRPRPERAGTRERMRGPRRPADRERMGERPMGTMGERTGERMDPEVREAMQGLREARREQTAAVAEVLDASQRALLREHNRTRGQAARTGGPRGR